MADKYNAKKQLLESKKRLQRWRQSSAEIMGEANKEFKRALPKIAEQGRIGTAMSVVSIGKNLIKIAKNKMNMKPMPGSKGYKKK